MKQAIAQVALQVSTADLIIAIPLTKQRCTQVLSRLDGEVQKSHVFLRSPNMREKNLNFKIQPKT